MPKKILIIGSKGMAGHVIYDILRNDPSYIVRDISRDERYFPSTYYLDITAFDKLALILKQDQPDIVINCAGILNNEAENNPDKAILVNSYLPHMLARIGFENGFKLIQLSTDCVFNGSKGNYLRTDVTDGTGYYARTKALGEIDYGHHLTLRTSIIGPELKEDGIGLFNWFMHQTGVIQGYIGARWTGITTIELAACIIKAIEEDIRGIQHLVNGVVITKFELISLFQKVFKRDSVEIHPSDSYKVDKSLEKDNTFFNVKTYPVMIEEMKVWIEQHKEMYPSYYFNP